MQNQRRQGSKHTASPDLRHNDKLQGLGKKGKHAQRVNFNVIWQLVFFSTNIFPNSGKVKTGRYGWLAK